MNELECRLLAPRLAFQKLMQAPRGKQLKISGNIVNVPADIANTVGMLPRLPNETGTIKVNLKRRLQYKSSALSLNVRPNKVLEAAKWLVNNGDLYKEEGIILNDTWLEDNSNIIYDERNTENLLREEKYMSMKALMTAHIKFFLIICPNYFTYNCNLIYIYANKVRIF